MNRAEWQHVAEEKLRASAALLAAQEWASAYYLAGYPVECGLKSCILARVTAAAEVIFDDRRFSEKCWTHSLEELVKLAGLEAVRAADMAASRALSRSWFIVKDWSEKSCYETKTHWVAKNLYNAITDNANGVMPWIRVRW